MPNRFLTAPIACVLLCTVVTAGAAERSFSLAIARGAVPAEQRTLRVGKGDTVRVLVSSDAPGELHLHGYGLAAKLAPPAHSELTFEAYATGRFPLEWHPAGAPAPSRGHHGPPLSRIEVRQK